MEEFKLYKFAVIADLHLPGVSSSVQHDALDFAVKSIKKSGASTLICLGDVTAYGETESAKHFREKMAELNIPVLCTMGNADIRSGKDNEIAGILNVKSEMTVDDIRFIAIDTSNEEVSKDDEALLNSSDENTIVVMHHPDWIMKKSGKPIVENFRLNGKYRALLYGHIHEYKQEGNIFSIQALDPDKAIGTPPCVTYFTLNENDINIDYDYFPVEVPQDLKDYLGVQCYNPIDDISYMTENGIKNIEIRPSSVYDDREKLKEEISKWRKMDGKYLSLHMPDFGYDKNGLTGMDKWNDAIECAIDIGADGITAHVPMASVGIVRSGAFPHLVKFFTENIKRLPDKCSVGIENMHMTEGEGDNDDRRYGYLPDECLEFMNAVNNEFGFKRAGVHFDVGHARNNIPFSGPYPIGAWYSLVGKYTVAYHIHQVEHAMDVLIDDKKMENHLPIKSIYGPLISYCGFFHSWNTGKINKGPVFLEIRGGREKYSLSVEYFKSLFK